MNKTELYKIGVDAATEFLLLNDLPLPMFVTYEAVASTPDIPARTLTFFNRATTNGAVQGTGTGLYYDGYVFVNVPACAWPVHSPNVRSWSWPGYKADRTPIGVVAHEVGHHCEVVLGKQSGLKESHDGPLWRALLAKYHKQVSGYEPAPSEAWAESMRLFILNPALLREALTARYVFITDVCKLKPLPRPLKRGWRAVLDNANYEPAAERFIEATGGGRSEVARQVRN